MAFEIIVLQRGRIWLAGCYGYGDGYYDGYGNGNGFGRGR